MVNFYKYFPICDKKDNWGLSLLNLGSTRIFKETAYPDLEHPSHHNFTWEKGRILQEYTLVYIIDGGGVLETESVNQPILNGTAFLIFPDERHRYKPNKETGWVEYWVSFNGTYIDDLVKNNIFTKENPVYNIGLNQKIIQLFEDIICESKEENNGYQAFVSGAIIHLLGILFSLNQQIDNDKNSLIESTVKKAKELFRAKILDISDVESVANELEVGYSWFRKVFKQSTGISPGQYLIQLKIYKAKELLGNPNHSIKEVAYLLQFDSPYYFSKLFKLKTGKTPLKFKQQLLEE